MIVLNNLSLADSTAASSSNSLENAALLPFVKVAVVAWPLDARQGPAVPCGVMGVLLSPPALQTWGAPGHLSPSWSGKAPSVGPQRLEEGAALVASAFQILRGFWRHSNET